MANVTLYARNDGAFASPSPCTQTWTKDLAVCEVLAFFGICRISRLRKTPDAIRGQRGVSHETPGAQATSSLSFGMFECRETQWYVLIGVRVLYRVDTSTHGLMYRISEERNGKVDDVKYEGTFCCTI